MKILRFFLCGLLTTSLAAHAVSLNLSSFLGGDAGDNVNDVAASAGGDIYAVGMTVSSDFPGADTATEPDGAVFVSRISGDGRGIVFTTLLDGRVTDIGISIAVDDLGAAYVTGKTFSRDFPLRNAFESNFNQGALGPFTGTFAFDAFVTKLSASGAIVFSTYLGGRSDDIGAAIALDADRRPYVAGITLSNNFPLKNEFQDAALLSAGNAFLTVFAADGQSLAYSTQLGGGSDDSANALAVDRNGNAYLAGRTASRNFPLRGPIQSSLLGSQDAWVAKINPFFFFSASLIYSTYLGGAGSEEAFGIAVDAAGQAHVTGVTGSGSFPIVAPPGLQVPDDIRVGDEAFVTKLSARGTEILLSTFLGGSGADRGNSIAVDSAGAVYVAGETSSADFQVVNAFQSAFSGGGTDGFVAKIDPLSSVLRWSSYLGGRDSDQAQAVALDSRGNVYLGGETFSGATFPRVAAFQNTFGGGGSDGFVARIPATPAESIGVLRGIEGKFFLRNTNTAGPADFTVTLGQGGDDPVAGNWLGFGDRPGIFRFGTFILKPFNSDLLCCNITFTFGTVGDLPVAGDWNGDGIDTVGILRPSNGVFALTDDPRGATLDHQFFFFFFDAPDALPLAGDWDGDGIDTVGLFVPSLGGFILTDDPDGGAVNHIFAFGQEGDQPVAGDWDGDGITTIGVLRGNQFLLRNSNSEGPADLVFEFGAPDNTLPVAGDWDGRP
ncbi:MAG TPA: SBBP repeat-containing protein [Thermoanaerobaculia bacterium]|jgi:hypothetical protein|nr:SBBP repeat-containing protein [Thermoanaerobaculia bacterium]